jgi:hypothetical protein
MLVERAAQHATTVLKDHAMEAHWVNENVETLRAFC